MTLREFINWLEVEIKKNPEYEDTEMAWIEFEVYPENIRYISNLGIVIE